MSGAGLSTREISRNAVRDELARVALPQFVRLGFDAVTFDDLAKRAGVSRSTVLRYFTTKEDLVLHVFDPVGDEIVGALRGAPAEASEWRALRRCLDPAVGFLVGSDQGVDLMRLIWATPALYSRLHEKQATWRPRMSEQLALRHPSDTDGALERRTRVAAALECLTVALETWLEEHPDDDLGSLLDRAFATISDTR